MAAKFCTQIRVLHCRDMGQVRCCCGVVRLGKFHFSKMLQLLDHSRAVHSDWLRRHIDVVTMVTHHQRCNAQHSGAFKCC